MTRPDSTPAEMFERWLEANDPNVPATRPYWQGDLAAESGTLKVDHRGRTVRLAPPNPAARDVADIAMAAYLAGRVALTRRRLTPLDEPGPARFEYLATRLGRRGRRLLAIVVTALGLAPGVARAEAFHQLAPGAALPAATRCADRALAAERRWGEQRPDNRDEDRRTGAGSFGGHVDGVQGSDRPRYGARVRGDSRTTAGSALTTTREILSWGACKWGLSSDITFARAVVESGWHMSTVEDAGQSYGILQIKRTVHLTTYPMSAERTPFSVDYALAWQRACVDGDFTWLGSDYRASTGARRTWGCVGAWFSGAWFDAGSTAYQGRVRHELAARRWERPGF